MPAKEEISEAQIKEYIVRAVGDVFDTMLRRSASLSDSVGSWPPLPPLKPEDATPQVVGTVGFLGDVNGLIYLYFDASFAIDCTGLMLGMTVLEVADAGDDVVNDAIGELTNMIVGTFKNGLCDAGYPCKLTVPSILRGLNFRIEPISTAQRYIYAFNCYGHRVVADILMTSEQ
jgi:chemotaxis protein CheX